MPVQHPAIQEVIDLHAFFEAWLGGALPDDDATFARFTAATDPAFTLISPAGAVMTHAAVVAWIRHAHGTRRGFRLWTTDHILQDATATRALVTYLEWQTHDEVTTCRISSACFVADGAAPHGYRWRHVHETWVTPA